MKYALILLLTGAAGCVTVNSPLFPGPLVIDRSCPAVGAMAPPMPTPTPGEPMPGIRGIEVPRLNPPEAEPYPRPTGGGAGLSRRLCEGS